MNSRLRIGMFGGLNVQQGDRIVTQFRTYKTGALLAYLAYHCNHAHPREELIALLWPESDLDQGRPSLSVALSSLRHQLEPPGIPAGAVLIASRATVQLNPASCETDVAAFNRAIQSAANTRSEVEQAQYIRIALDRYRGEFLPGYYEEWCLAERERLAATYLEALRLRIKHLVKGRNLPGALDCARQVVQADPLCEATHRELMRLYVALGRPAAALQHYQQLVHRLQEQTGTAPSPVTRRLAREIAAWMSQAPEESAIEPKDLPDSTSVPAVQALPVAGTVTFLLIEVADARTSLEQPGEAYAADLVPYHSILHREFARHGGQVDRADHDHFLAAFSRATDALACAVAVQRAITSLEERKGIVGLSVRMAMHTAEIGSHFWPSPLGSDCATPAMGHANWILNAARAGQILCSLEVAALLRRNLEPQVGLIDLGLYQSRTGARTERLFQVCYPGRSQDSFPPTDLERAPTSNLPLQFTRFFGRASDIVGLMEMLTSGAGDDTPNATSRVKNRLVSLTGPGGIGKTRLALEVADRLQDRFYGDVWFVPLAAVTEGERILETVMNSLRLLRAPNADPVAQIAQALSARPALLVLDNFEQLLETGMPVVGTLLERIPLLTCLVTSRQKLNLIGEREFPVEPMPLPQASDLPEQLSLYDSVQLFLDRAQTVKVDFQVTNANASAVAELCARLEGIPLAIELAASRAQVLTPSQMLAQLEHRFDFLVSRRRDITERHRTLRSAVDWSYRLLAPELQRFFAQLSIFQGGWSLDAAETICEIVTPRGGEMDTGLALDYLAQLRECSLVMTEDVPNTPEIRFYMLESLREYAAELLPLEERTRLAGRHADYYLIFAERARTALRGPEQMLWLGRLTVEYDNLQVAQHWDLESGAIEQGLRLGRAMERFWLVRGHLEDGLGWLSRLLAKSSSARHAGPRAYALMTAGRLAAALGDYAQARSHYEESLRILREQGDAAGIGSLLQSMGLLAWYQSDYPVALSHYEESLKILRESGDRPEIGSALSNLAGLMVKRGQYDKARSLLDETLAIRREMGDTWGIASALGNLGVVARDQGDFGAAWAFHTDSLVLWVQLGDHRSTAECLEMLSGTAGLQGQFERSVRLLAAASGIRETIHAPVAPNARADHELRMSNACKAIGRDAFAAAREEGAAMTLKQAIVCALEIS